MGTIRSGDTTSSAPSSTSMNFFQRANLTASFFVFTFLVTGLAIGSDLDLKVGESLSKKTIYDYVLSHKDIIFLSGFIINFRIKVLLDDHKYFGEREQSKHITRFFGFIIGIYCWTMWGFSSFSIRYPVTSSKFLLLALILASGWIFIHLCELVFRMNKLNPPSNESTANPSERSETERSFLGGDFRQSCKWLGFNIAYGCGLSIYIWKTKLGFIFSNEYDYLIFIALIVFNIIDYIFSKTYDFRGI